MHEFVDEFFAHFVHEFKYEIRMDFLHEKLVMLRMACTVQSSLSLVIDIKTTSFFTIRKISII